MKLKGVTIDGTEAVPTVLIADPSPFFDRIEDGGLFLIFAWGFPTVTIAIMAILRWFRRRALLEKGHESIYLLRWDIYVIIAMSTAAALGVNYLVFSHFGRYSRFTAVLPLFTCVLVIICAIHMVHAAIKARRERARGLFSEGELEELKYSYR